MGTHLKHKAANHGIDVVAMMRPYDELCWPNATHGFFRFKEKIPQLISIFNGAVSQAPTL